MEYQILIHFQLLLKSDKTFFFSVEFLSYEEDKNSRNPHCCEERKNDTNSEHKSESLNKRNSKNIQDYRRGEGSDMRVPDSRP